MGSQPLVFLALLAVASASLSPIIAWTSADSVLPNTPYGQVFSTTDYLRELVDSSLTASKLFVIQVDELSTKTIASLRQDKASFIPRAFASAASTSFVPASFSAKTLENELESLGINFAISNVSSVSVDCSVVLVQVAGDAQAIDDAVAVLASSAKLDEQVTFLIVSSTETLSVSRRSVALPPPSPPYVARRLDQRQENANQWFSVPILMGVIVILFIITLMLVGVYGLMTTQTMQQWPDASDKNIQVPQ